MRLTQRLNHCFYRQNTTWHWIGFPCQISYCKTIHFSVMTSCNLPFGFYHPCTLTICISITHRTAQSAPRIDSRSLEKNMTEANVMYVNAIKYILIFTIMMKTQPYNTAAGCWPKVPSIIIRVQWCTRQQVSTSIVRAHRQPLPRPNCSNYRRTAGKADAASQKASFNCVLLRISSSSCVQEAEGSAFWRNKYK